jgi:hypothetical protein
MRQQPWLPATFAVIMIATAAYCLTRLALSWRQRRPTDRQVDAVHVLMGVAMTGMLVPRLRVLPPGGWETLFAAGAALFLWRTARTARAAGQRAGAAHRPAHDLQHVLGCGAMMYMLAAMAGAGAGRDAAAAAMSGAAGSSALALVMAVALFGCVVWNADRISTLAPVAVLAVSRAGPATATGYSADTGIRGKVPLSPRLAVCCEIVMGVTMGYMLIVLL